MRISRWLGGALLTLLPLTAQQIETVAGTGAPGFAGDGGDARAALVSGPRSLAVSGAGDLYILDYDNSRVRRVTGGAIQTVAGNGEIGAVTEGAATATPFISLYAIGWNAATGRLLAGSSDGLHAVDGQGQLRAVVSGQSVPVFEASSPALYLGNFLQIERVEADGTRTLVAGSGEIGDSGDGGPAVDARFQHAGHVAADRLGRLWIADAESHRIRRFLPGGAIETVAGNGTPGYSGDGGPARDAQLHRPSSIAVDVAGNLYIADLFNYRIRRVNAASGQIETLAGTGQEETAGDGGPARQASFATLQGLAVNCTGLFVSDLDRVRRVALSEPLIALAGVADVESGKKAIRAGRTFRIEGCNLAAAEERAAGPDGQQPLPTRLGETEVTVNGVPAGLLAVSATSIEARLPAGTSPATAATVRVTVKGQAVEAAADIQED